MSKQLPVIQQPRMFLESPGNWSSNWISEQQLLDNLLTHCRDCVHFRQLNDTGLCHAYEPMDRFQFEHVLGVPQDGSGYCHNAKRK
jgi:hypothetical protein